LGRQEVPGDLRDPRRFGPPEESAPGATPPRCGASDERVYPSFGKSAAGAFCRLTSCKVDQKLRPSTKEWAPRQQWAPCPGGRGEGSRMPGIGWAQTLRGKKKTKIPEVGGRRNSLMPEM